MKKIFLLPFFLFLFSPYLNAQQGPKSNFYLGYGFATAPDLTNTFGGLATTLASFGLVTIENSEYTGCYFAGCSFKAKDNLDIDIKAGYQRYKSNIFSAGTKIGQQEENYYTILGGIKYEYGRIGFVTTYSGITLGAFINSDKETYGTETSEKTNTFLGYQITAFGVRTGGSVGAFLEAGFGYMGMIAGGLSLKF